MATELAEGVWHLDLGAVNAYLLDDDELVLVDAGMPWNADDIREGLATGGYRPADVDRVVLTHFDLDHAGALSKLGLDAPIHAPDPDAGYLTGERRPAATTLKGFVQNGFRLLVSAPDRPVERVSDGEQVGPLAAYRTPGHTPGHTVYVAEDAGVAFLGDLVVEDDGALATAPWFLNLDTDRSRASSRELAERAPDFEVAAMGHGDPLVEGGGEALAALAAGQS
ncbi:MBL fold hydrolase [Halobacteriales archaeon QS_1_68_20]|nr:MAG: MBL fold hydrolase [Halobacteriales archaeon QS_1_68_20]